MGDLLTAAELQQLDRLLSRLEPGMLPLPVFLQICRLAVVTAVEFIPLRHSAAGVEVLLFPRPDDDPVWPGMLHTPGTIIRPTDTTIDDAISRLLRDELAGIRLGPAHWHHTGHGHSDRGAGFTLEHVVEVIDAPDELMHPVDRIPDTFIAEQQPMLDRAVCRFNAGL